jgi:hypothetical protein
VSQKISQDNAEQQRMGQRLGKSVIWKGPSKQGRKKRIQNQSHRSNDSAQRPICNLLKANFQKDISRQVVFNRHRKRSGIGMIGVEFEGFVKMYHV